eukprot:2018839-Amphidinium_carterae.2
MVNAWRMALCHTQQEMKMTFCESRKLVQTSLLKLFRSWGLKPCVPAVCKQTRFRKARLQWFPESRLTGDGPGHSKTLLQIRGQVAATLWGCGARFHQAKVFHIAKVTRITSCEVEDHVRRSCPQMWLKQHTQIRHATA